MNLLSLHISNFGPFRGRHTIDLATNPESPLIIIGALNGGGKTTLLDAMQLALYGAKAKVSNFAPTLFRRGRRAAALRNRSTNWGEFAA